MKKRMLAFMMAIVMVLSTLSGITAKADTCGGLEPEDVYQPAEDEVVKDPILHWAIRAAMNSIKGGVKLTADVVGDKSVKDISYELCAHPEDFETEEWAEKQFWIESLEGLQYAKSASMIDIAYTSAVEGKSIKDLTPLSGLTQLETLILKQNNIDDISALSGLVNLKTLDVSANYGITDVSAVKDMTKLESLNISFNAITSADALSGLESLKYLSISNNNITELPDLSKLKNVYFFDASHNQLTDVSALAGMTNLQQLNLSGNSGITDITPLANLLKLEKSNTSLPDNSKKDDLFAAIEVNKLFGLFNISKMKESDLTNVQNALAAYDALTDEQKTYFDDARIAAARSNMEKVQSGGTADYYPEYDVEGEKQPVFDSIEIKVVDKKGNPLAGVEFVKMVEGSESPLKTVTTDSVGTFVLKHSASDAIYDEIIVKPAGDDYVSTPEYITYSVAWGNTTLTVNGKTATGLEELVFTLIPNDDYADKTALAAVIAQADEVEEAYKYTKESYQAFETALKDAKAVYENADAAKDAVDEAAESLETAIKALEKADILTELKLIVKDKNGNIFTRPFKFQIRVPETNAEAWNEYSNANTGIAYLKTSPGWADGKVWEITACFQEPYEMEPIIVTVGVKDGQRYYKTVDGKNVDVDFEKVVVVTPIESDTATRTPDSAVLAETLAEAKEVNKANYTPASVEVLETAIETAQAALDNGAATQEMFNTSVAELKAAQSGLKEVADKTALQREIDLKGSYTESLYTEKTWMAYQEKLVIAENVNADGNATQAEVDNALDGLKKASAALVLKANTSALETKLEEAKAYSEEDYVGGFDALQDAIADAEAVLAKAEPTQAEVDAQVLALQDAIDALEKKPVEPEYTCYPSMFRAKVLDKDGNPVAGVKFEAVIGTEVDKDVPITSNENGIITYYTYGPIQYGKTTYIRLADDRYATNDEHYFTLDSASFTAVFATIDGQPYVDGLKLTYVLGEPGSVEPAPGPGTGILSDEKAFRAKVVDEAGNPVNGVSFKFNDGYDTSVILSENGKVERAVGQWEPFTTFTVTLEEGQRWTCDTVCTYYQGGDWVNGAKLETVNGKALAEAGEIVFVLKEAGSEEPAPEPETGIISDEKAFRAKVVDEAGNPVNGAVFAFDSGSEIIEITSADGKIERAVGQWEVYKEFSVVLKEGQGWACDTTCTYYQGGDWVNGAKLSEINGKTLAEAGEIVFVLKEASQEITGMQTLVIPVKGADGKDAPANIKFIRYDMKYMVENNMFANDGKLEWKLGAYEGGDYEIYLPEDSSYIASPGLIRVTVGTENGTPVIETINGVPAAESNLEIVITEKGTDTSDILTFRAKVVDKEGNPLEGIPFRVANGDPDEIVSDENGMIEYAVTAWDTDMTMKVSLKSAKEWECSKEVSFSVIEDPSDPYRGIIESIDGKPVAESGQIVFTLEKHTTESKNHYWDYGTITSQPTCTSEGEIVYKCTVKGCKAESSDKIPADASKHNYNTNYTFITMPTCTEGAVLKLLCTYCGEALESSTITTWPLPHTYKDKLTEATLEADGKIAPTCTGCGHEDKEKTTVISRVKEVKLSKTSFTYTGKVQKPTVTVTDAEGNVISSANYTVKYSSGCKNVGKYGIRVTFKGNYSGSVPNTFTITPKGTSISSLSKATKAFTVKWKKQSTQVTGYQIQYTTDKTFQKSVKTTTVSSYKTTSKKITKLSAKKTYYVRIRTYKTVNGTKYYSGWSTVKSVKTK